MPPPAARDFARVAFSAADVDLPAYEALKPGCLRLGFLPSFRHGIVLEAAMVTPEREELVRAIRQFTHQEVRRFGISRADFDEAVRTLEGGKVPPDPGESGSDGTGCGDEVPEAWDFQESGARGVAARMVGFAFGSGASDLLLDEQEEWMDVAVKIGGRKEILPPVDRGAAAALLKAFKEMAGLPTHAMDSWLSGAATVALPGGGRADLRIEITPTVHGQSLVARVQDRQRQLARMEVLPFTNPRHLRLATACLGQKQGLIVATGPTGQGKTTTLYSCLGRLDRSALNIRTLEDPVEFIVPWITQIPVGSGTGRGYGDGLRSLLRQAPHVILRGEIRSREVAQTCVEAVDTGHLILATLHTRDAIGVVARLLDLGLTGRQVATSLLLAIGQRLVRRLCPGCRRPVAPTRAQALHFESHGLPAPPIIFEPGACPRCGHRGELGVVPLFELFNPGVGDELEDAIGRSTPATYREDRLRARWIERGGEPLVREGLRLAAAGEISHAEVLGHERRPLLDG